MHVYARVYARVYACICMYVRLNLRVHVRVYVRICVTSVLQCKGGGESNLTCTNRFGLSLRSYICVQGQKGVELARNSLRSLAPSTNQLNQ